VPGRLSKNIRTPKSHRNSIGDSHRCTFDDVWLACSTVSARSVSKCVGLLDVDAFLDISVQLDSPEGQKKEAELTGQDVSDIHHGYDIRKGFVYKRVPHVTFKSIVNNPDIREG
jgi:hypothetical protein